MRNTRFVAHVSHAISGRISASRKRGSARIIELPNWRLSKYTEKSGWSRWKTYLCSYDYNGSNLSNPGMNKNQIGNRQCNSAYSLGAELHADIYSSSAIRRQRSWPCPRLSSCYSLTSWRGKLCRCKIVYFGVIHFLIQLLLSPNNHLQEIWQACFLLLLTLILLCLQGQFQALSLSAKVYISWQSDGLWMSYCT